MAISLFRNETELNAYLARFQAKKKTRKKAPARRPLTEADVTKQIRGVLNGSRIWHWKAWQGPMSQPKGVSDLIGIYQGRMLAIEVKRPGGTVRPEQIAFLERVNREGGIGFVAYSVEDVIERLGLQCTLTPLFAPE